MEVLQKKNIENIFENGIEHKNEDKHEKKYCKEIKRIKVKMLKRMKIII